MAILILGFALGLGFGSLLDPRSGVDPAAEPQTLPTTPEEETPDAQAPSGLAEMVPGWHDSLVAIADSHTGVLHHVLWPASGEPRESAMAGGESPLLDAGGQMIAQTAPSTDQVGDILSWGRFNLLSPVAAGVTSYAWHDTESGRLAYTTRSNEVWSLWEVEPTGSSALVVSEAGGEGRLTTWGEWGYAIQTSGPQVRLLTRDGALKDVHPGTAFGSDGSGWIAVAGDRIELVSSGGGVRGVDVPLEVLGVVHDAGFSPDGGSLAILGSDGLVVTPTADDGRVLRFEGGSEGFVDWSTDSRFVILPAVRGLYVQDLAAGIRRLVLDSYSVLEAGVARGPGS
jgi:hypothetical protein